MRSERWWQNASITEAVFQHPARFEMIQATRLLRHVPYVQQHQYWADDFRFQSSLSLRFPETEIEALTLQDQRVHFTNLIVGLTGIQGALPYSYSHKVKHAPRKQRQQIEQFLALFNHKLIAQYIDASISYHLPLRYEVEQDNHYLNILHALNGYISHQHQQLPLDDYFAEFSGLMQGQNNSRYAIKTILSCVFKQPVQVNEYIFEQFELSQQQKTILGAQGQTRLGVNSFCGGRIRQADSKIEIEIGPLTLAEYQAFLPNRPQSQKLKRILSTWCSPTLIVDLRLVLAKEAIQALCLSRQPSVGLAEAAFLMPRQRQQNRETCYTLMGVQR